MQDLVQSVFEGSELCFRAIHGQCCAINLSTLSTLAKIRSPWSDHACIHRCKSDMKLRNSPFSLLPSQSISWDEVTDSIRLGVSCLRGYVLECCVDAVQHVHPAIDRLVHFCAQLLFDVSHFLSQLLLEHCEVCCGDHVCLLFLLELPLVLLLQQCCAWPRSCPSVPVRGVDHRHSATMSNASLFCGTLEPTRMRQVCALINKEKKRKREREKKKKKKKKKKKEKQKEEKRKNGETTQKKEKRQKFKKV